jgi:hypothetical protein
MAKLRAPWSGPRSSGRSLQLGQLVRVEGAEPLVRLDREREQERGDRGLDPPRAPGCSAYRRGSRRFPNAAGRSWPFTRETAG